MLIAETKPMQQMMRNAVMKVLEAPKQATETPQRTFVKMSQ